MNKYVKLLMEDLGLEENEKFYILQDGGNPYRFNIEGKLLNYNSAESIEKVVGLMRGDLKIKKEPLPELTDEEVGMLKGFKILGYNYIGRSSSGVIRIYETLTRFSHNNSWFYTNEDLNFNIGRESFKTIKYGYAYTIDELIEANGKKEEIKMQNRQQLVEQYLEAKKGIDKLNQQKASKYMELIPNMWKQWDWNVDYLSGTLVARTKNRGSFERIKVYFGDKKEIGFVLTSGEFCWDQKIFFSPIEFLQVFQRICKDGETSFSLEKDGQNDYERLDFEIKGDKVVIKIIEPNYDDDDDYDEVDRTSELYLTKEEIKVIAKILEYEMKERKGA